MKVKLILAVIITALLSVGAFAFSYTVDDQMNQATIDRLFDAGGMSLVGQYDDQDHKITASVGETVDEVVILSATDVIGDPVLVKYFSDDLVENFDAQIRKLEYPYWEFEVTFKGKTPGTGLFGWSFDPPYLAYLYTIEVLPAPERVVITDVYGTELIEDNLVNGNGYQLLSQVYPAEARQNVAWSSDNTDAVVVDENGYIQCVGLGTANIICRTTIEDDSYNKEAVYTVHVYDAPEKITVSGEQNYMYSGETMQLSAEILPATALQEVIWTSSDDSFATVDENGLVTAVSCGTVTIKATSPMNSKVFGTYVIYVDPRIEIEGVPEDPQVGDAFKLVAKVYPEGISQYVSWSSTNMSVVRAVSGNVNIKKPGNATVSATSIALPFLKATVDFNIKVNIDEVIILNPVYEMYVTEAVKLKASILPSNAIQNIGWSSSNWNVARVVSGNLTAKNPGKTVITATALDDPTKTCSFELTVVPLKLDLVYEKTDMVIGETQIMKTYIGSREFDSTWKTTNPAMINVVSGSVGTVTAKALGEVDITATCSKFPELSATVHVKCLIDHIDIIGGKPVIEVGESVKLSAVCDGITQHANWSSSDWNTARVILGQVTGKKPGKVTITAALAYDSSITATYEIEVIEHKEDPVFDVTPTELSLGIGDQGEITVNTTIEGRVEWSIDDPIAELLTNETGCTVIARDTPGNATITAKITDGDGAEHIKTITLSVYGE
ncbi:MAG: Ig-like domain-containing protein [Armatimonadetes bacterium]|nr:Ig-like domain-containing protein [Candidatus Hippobium faecium]